jgi:hypothetical protein
MIEKEDSENKKRCRTIKRVGTNCHHPLGIQTTFGIQKMNCANIVGIWKRIKRFQTNDTLKENYHFQFIFT